MDAIFVIFPPVLGMAVVTAELARSKGYSGRWWFLTALIIPLFSMFILFALRNKRKNEQLIKLELDPMHQDKVLFQKNS